MKRLTVFLFLAIAVHAQTVNLPTSKRLIERLPGMPQRTNSLPTAVALSPNQRYLAILNNGYGTEESGGQQSIAILDLKSNELRDYPDARLGQNAAQTYFLGLAWSSNGQEIYASIASLTDPEGKKPGSTGNGVAVYSFSEGKLVPARFLKIPLQPLPKGKKFTYDAEDVRRGFANPYPAGIGVIQVSSKRDQLLVAANLADALILMDSESGRVIRRINVSNGKSIPSQFPYVCSGSSRGSSWCSEWNGSAVVEVDTLRGKVLHSLSLRSPQSIGTSSSHPTAVLDNSNFIYVALANTDEIAVVDSVSKKVVRYIGIEFPGPRNRGVQPIALAAEGSRLFVALANANSIAVIDIPEAVICLHCDKQPTFRSEGVLGFIPTQWYPTALAVHDGELLIATGKGAGAGPNSAPATGELANKGHQYIASMLHGSIARVKIREAEKNLTQLTAQVLDANLMRQAPLIQFGVGQNPIKHVIYVIKENRTYDQLFGDLKPGNGDPSLTLYGWDVTPNHHKLAQQFGILDNFYDSGEVSGNGHVWSTAATSSDYTEKTWQIGYRSEQRMYDYEGKVGDIYPLHENIADINEPGTGYLWANASRRGLSYRHYGEYVDTKWCAAQVQSSAASTGTATAACGRAVVRKGEPLPENLGGTPSPWPWDVPIIAQNIPTKPELRGHFDPHYADFRMEYPDQLRMDEFLREFRQFVAARETGRGEQLPNLIVLRLPNDHTAGTKVGMPTPSAAVADNDLAVGRLAEAVSNSPYWDDTAIFVLEDDAQDGADHVDAHRSVAMVISKYSQSSPEKPHVDSSFHTTVSVLRTMELLLGMPPMNNNDAQAAPIQLFGGSGAQQPFKADYRNRDNGLLYATNPPKAQGSKESAKMDFKHADSVDTELLNAILWRDRKGNIPVPKPVHNVIHESKSGEVEDDD